MITVYAIHHFMLTLTEYYCYEYDLKLNNDTYIKNKDVIIHSNII